MTADLHLDPNGPVWAATRTGLIELRIPTCAEWARWYDELARLDFSDLMDGSTAHLNVTILRALGHPGPVDPDAWPLWIHDPTVASKLIEHWRDRPISPFTPTAARDDQAKPDTPSTLPPGTRALFSLYRACASVMSPAEVDRQTLTQIAAMASDGETTTTNRYRRESRRSDGRIHREVDTRAPGTPYRYRGERVRPLPARPAR